MQSAFRHFLGPAAAVAWLAVSAAADAQGWRADRESGPGQHVSIFAGRHVDNSWQDVFDTENDLVWADAGLVGVAVGHEWRRTDAAFSVGIEFQTVAQFGDQNHVEFNLPVFVRYHAPVGLPVLRGFAFGLGPSYATKVPRYEVASRGDSQQFLAYWAMEAEFGDARRRGRVFTRLHHRSGAFGTIAGEGASNVIAVGYRRRW